MSGSLSDAEQQASRWIARLEAHDVSLADHQRFRAWLAKSSDNRVAYEGLARTWDKLDALAYLDGPLPAARAPTRRWLIAGGVTAAAAVVAVGAMFLPGADDAGATPYVTGIGQRRSFSFPDGSTAELNADSVMRVSYSISERHAHLTQGEALFNVAHDPTRPFVVKTPFGEVRAHGTSFLVRLGTNSARVTVLEGAIEVAKTGLGLLHASPAAADANHEVSFGATAPEVTAIAPQALTHRLAWRSGMLAFDGDTLADAALEIERQTGVHFEFADPAIGDLRIGGYISATDVDAFVRLIEENLSLHVARQGLNARISSSA